MDPIEAVAAFMKRHHLLLVTAESCTAGLIASRLADLPGAATLLDCAFVVYSPQSKQSCLAVKPETLARCNLTSETVAREMVLGALKRSRANVAVANTGIADSPDDETPAGAQCFAWAFQLEGRACTALFAETRRFCGNRHTIRQASAEYALKRIPYYYDQMTHAAPQRWVAEAASTLEK